MVVAAKEVMWASCRHALQEISEGCKACVAPALVVECACAQQLELRPMVGVAVHLPVVQLDGANGLRCWKSGETQPSQSAIAAMLFVCVQPGHDRRGRDGAAS